jgi:hypothetical protein
MEEYDYDEYQVYGSIEDLGECFREIHSHRVIISIVMSRRSKEKSYIFRIFQVGGYESEVTFVMRDYRIYNFLYDGVLRGIFYEMGKYGR